MRAHLQSHSDHSALLLPVTWLRLSALIELVAGPEQSAGNQIEIHIALHRLVAVAKRGAEHAGFPISVHSNARVGLAFILWRTALRQRCAIGPNLLYFIELIRIVF